MTGMYADYAECYINCTNGNCDTTSEYDIVYEYWKIFYKCVVVSDNSTTPFVPDYIPTNITYSSNWAYYLLFLLIVPLIVAIVVVCYFCNKKIQCKKQRRRQSNTKLISSNVTGIQQSGQLVQLSNGRVGYFVELQQAQPIYQCAADKVFSNSQFQTMPQMPQPIPLKAPLFDQIQLQQ
ncbi:Hypothetical_protein [Hexamita inflata]|uniref:Hypothetical_protein n=1 Tax=Hexamita inflata TaxID=28002 RepID=A0AA86QRD6_9EUKA|nr:Hypothetical protein HINF_LOCUS25359 [Hexamita inflata]CAI9957844.1 Hypothetical protein HINF_LOCUS45489 [Hexamita inflata]CAI9962595.1 Hypothetical protein HINF_LOCUS50240 [Hexamita inflata]